MICKCFFTSTFVSTSGNIRIFSTLLDVLSRVSLIAHFLRDARDPLIEVELELMRARVTKQTTVILR